MSPSNPISGPVAVCIDRPVLSLDRPFTYDLPGGLDAGVGSLVSVRFHGKLSRGWVLGGTDDLPKGMLKVHKVVSPVRFFDERLLELFRWMSERYIAPLATVIGRSFPPRVAGEDAGNGRGASPASLVSARLSPVGQGSSARSGVAPPASPPALLSGYKHGRDLLEGIA